MCRKGGKWREEVNHTLWCCGKSEILDQKSVLRCEARAGEETRTVIIHKSMALQTFQNISAAQESLLKTHNYFFVVK